MRTLARVLVAALACLAAAAGLAAGPIRVVDDDGAALELARPARRIVSLAPHATEMLFAAGAGPAVVAVAAHSDHPPEARRLPRVADAAMIDLENVVALSPDLVVAWPYTAPQHLAALRALGIPVFFSNPRSIAGIASDIEKLGVLAGTEAQAAQAAAALRTRLAGLKAKYAGARPLSVFYEIWNRPLYTVGGRHLISEAIALCGGRNVFADLALPAPEVNLEAVIAAAPQVIIGADDAGGRPAWLAEWSRWPDLPAVRDGNVLVANGDLLHRPGPRFVDGVAGLCDALAAARTRARP
ncbi:MAG: cobalamin-binding protein [Burkholderiales bacterium]|nr:cobalamin-binding protein [Burkholderiales bacterium]